MKINTTFIKEKMKENLFTARWLALQVWITENYMCSILCEKKEPWPNIIRKLIEILKINKDDIIIK